MVLFTGFAALSLLSLITNLACLWDSKDAPIEE